MAKTTPVVRVEGLDKAVEETVEGEIRAAIAKALGKNPEALVRQVVDLAMTQKKNSYDKTTIFQAAVNEMIRRAAKEELKAWLEEKSGEIRAALAARLNEDEGVFVNTVAKNVCDGLASSFYVRAELRARD